MLRTRFIALATFFGVVLTANGVFAAWTGPTQSPPLGNTPAPMNVGSTFQDKTGGAWFDGGVGVNAGSSFCIGGTCISSWPTAASSTVNPGLINQLAFYASAGTLLSGTPAVTLSGSDLALTGHILQNNTFGLWAKTAAGVSQQWMWPRNSDNIMYTNFDSAGWNIRNNAGTNVMFMQNGGNVGVGTVAPTAKFAVTNTGAGSSFLVEDSASPDTSPFVILSNGFTAVGTSTSNSVLSVYGGYAAPEGQMFVHQNAAANNPTLRIRQTGSGGSANDTQGLAVEVQGNASSNIANFSYWDGTTATSRLIVRQNGNVGVGITAPAQKLSVAGTIESTSGGYKFPDGTTQITAAAGGVTGSGTIGRIPRLTAASAIGDSSITSDGVSATAQGSFSATASITSPQYCIGASCINAWPSSSTSTGSVNAGLINQMAFYAANGSVISGTPVATISGTDVALTGHIIQNNTFGLWAKTAAGVSQQWMWPRNSDNIMYTNFDSAGWNIRNNAGTNVMFMQNGGNVGVGTVSPSFLLDTNGVGRFQNSTFGNGAGGTNLILRTSAGASRPASLSLWGSPNFGGGADVSPRRTADITAAIGGSWGTEYMSLNVGLGGSPNDAANSTIERMRITGNGNVGIGTTAPGQKLSVAGTVESTSGGFRFPDGTTQTTAAASGVTSSGTTGYIPRLTATSTLGNSSITSDGVSATANGNLFVTGAGNALYMGDRSGNGFNSAFYRSANVTRLWDNTAGDVISYNNSGNVGIGNTAPGYKLDVTGGVRASGEIISTSANAFRMVSGTIGSFFRNDGANTYLLLTASGDPYGGFNALRPFYINNTTGLASFSNGISANTITSPQYCIGASCINAWPSGSIGGSGTAGTIARFSTTGTTLGDSSITSDGTTATANSSFFVSTAGLGSLQMQGNQIWKNSGAGPLYLQYSAAANAGLVVGGGPTAQNLTVANGNAYATQFCFNGGACTSSWATIGGSGTAGYVPRFTTSGVLLGNSSIMSDGTSSTAQGNLYATGIIQANGVIQSTSGAGMVRMVPGDALHAGYFEWYKSNGSTRLGYMGYDNTNLNLNLENGANFTISNGDVSIDQNITAAGTVTGNGSGGWGGLFNGTHGVQGVGTTGPGVQGLNPSGAQYAGLFYSNLSGSTWGTYVYISQGSWGVYTNQNIGAKTFLYNSDRRLKKDITPLGGNLAKMLKLQPVTYHWIDPAADKSIQIGLIAQDVRKVVPEIVNTDASTTMQSIDYARLTPLLVGSVQELNAKIEAQQKEIDELRAAIKALRK